MDPASRASVATVLVKARNPGLAFASFVLLALFACTTPPPPPAPTPPRPVEPASPAWVKQPLSWEKLEAIEQWLASDAERHGSALVIEGELQLNEGRLHFAERDRSQRNVSDTTLRVRVEHAQKGFEQVLAKSNASTGQRTRATIGKQRAIALLGTPGAGPLAIVARAQWGARAARADGMTKMKGQWSRVTVHHSAETTTDPDGGTIEQSMQTVRSIQKFHMDDGEHRWGDIGYHFMIDSAGRILEGRALTWQGAHAGGQENVQNIGVCLLGDLIRRPPTPAAMESLKLLLDHLRTTYKIRASRVYAHSELNTTRCPGNALIAWIKRYRG